MYNTPLTYVTGPLEQSKTPAHFFCLTSCHFTELQNMQKVMFCSGVLKLRTRIVLETDFIKNRLSGASI